MVVEEAGTDEVGGSSVVVVGGPMVVDVVDAPCESTVVGVVSGIEGVAVEVVDDGDGLGPSGEAQPVGGTPDPVWPGMSTVPAHPKSEKVACKVTEPPSLKVSVDLTCRMYPALSIEMSAVSAVYPCALRSVSAAEMVWDSALVVPAAVASWSRFSVTWYTVTGTPLTVPVPVSAAASMAGWMRSR